MPVSLSRYVHQLRNIADRSRRYSERHFKLIGAIGVFTLPLSSFVEDLVGDPSFNTIYIRSLAGCAGLPLLFHDRLSPVFKRNLDWIWIACITFALPFAFGLILTLNAAYTDHGDSPSPIWVYQYLVALFIFIQLINHGPMSVLLWGISTVLVGVFCMTINSPNLAALQEVWVYPFPVYVTALVVGSITNRNIHVVQAEQIRAASAIGTNIAHELRTPLASIRVLAHGIGRFLPELVDAYEKAKSAGLSVSAIAPRQIRELESGLRSIQSEVDYSNTIIDMLLANTSETSLSEDRFEQFPISDAIHEAITRFPFNNSHERRLVTYSIESDFVVFGPKPFVVHVMFNLIKNALYFVQKAGDGHLEVAARVRNGVSMVEVTDTGTGIPANLQPRIFDRFFSSDPSSQGAGIGLSFCRMVMESIGGGIVCESKEGEYTTFRLAFPSQKSRRT